MKKYIILKKSLKTNILIELHCPGTFLAVESSTSSPGGNQADGLPPASSVFGKVVSGELWFASDFVLVELVCASSRSFSAFAFHRHGAWFQFAGTPRSPSSSLFNS